MGKKRDQILVRARKIIENIWNNSHIRGRSWAIKMNGKNPYYERSGTNVILANNNDLVILTEGKQDNEVIIHEFSKSSGTKLGKDILLQLEKGKFKIKRKGRI